MVDPPGAALVWRGVDILGGFNLARFMDQDAQRFASAVEALAEPCGEGVMERVAFDKWGHFRDSFEGGGDDASMDAPAARPTGSAALSFRIATFPDNAMRALLLAAALLPLIAQAQTPASLKDIAVFPERDAPASVLAANESKIAAEVAGQIVELTDAVGGVVPKGTVLARIDARDYELALARARAALDASRARLLQAETQLTRARDLHAKNFISADGLTQRETEAAVQRADVKLNEAQVASAERNLTKCVIRAPFAAVVRARLAQSGELAAPGTPLVSLVEAGRTELTAQVQPRDVASLRAAQAVTFISGSVETLTRVLRVSPVIGRESRTVEARLATGAIAAWPAKTVAATRAVGAAGVGRGADTAPAVAATSVASGLQPGLEGRIVWREHRPHIPPAHLQRREGKLGVYLAEGGRFVALDDAQEGRPALIPAGLPLGTRVLSLPPLPAAPTNASGVVAGEKTSPAAGTIAPAAKVAAPAKAVPPPSPVPAAAVTPSVTPAAAAPKPDAKK